ncbi:glutaminase A [Candidatus Mycobacterium methanotrophicum]|uniref:Glutaminase n=1 Tax=Candidatus Mycobacterium methanotrophicum TaxID=2943498 RepID=A0ABY4QLP2_9MYCO|nr:glutaminase A [Candidatus Mycobacterium methanotrophicum]UQX11516.1 glutaminase A [Candidatus Mycobacterium methanotrophicum]
MAATVPAPKGHSVEPPPGRPEPVARTAPLELTDQQRGWLADASRRDLNGWLHVTVKGSPAARGFQYGFLVADEYAESIRVYRQMTYQHIGMSYDFFVERAADLHADKVPDELGEEMEGVAAGLTSAGVPATFDDVLGLNDWMELIGYWWPKNSGRYTALSPVGDEGDHCSAFLATGDATADGSIIPGHTSFTDFWQGQFENVILDITPADGNRMIMQAAPGWIASMSDFWLTGAGLAITPMELAAWLSQGPSAATVDLHQVGRRPRALRFRPLATTPISADRIAGAVAAAHARHKKNRRGKNAAYIPALTEVDPKLFGVCVATVDGQTFSAGDADRQFALESISKVFTAALAMEQVGARVFHRKVGADPTGLSFNSVMALELHNGMPMSPMVNAGATTAASLVSATDAEDRWRHILAIQSDFAGRAISVSEEITASERFTNFHNRAIAWLLLCGGNMYCDPMEACDIYTRQCSTLVSATDLAMMGATLANAGINPVTGKRVIKRANVSHVLAEMTMQGLYTSSGDWAYTVGLPAKSGVGGGLVAVSPGRLAIAAYSPPLDKAGNSVRAQAAVTQIAHTVKLGLFDTQRRV